MADEQKATIVTMKVSDSVPVPKELGETRVMTCDRCGEPVYTTSTTFDRLASEETIIEHEIVCNVCVLPDLQEARDTDERIIAADPDLQDFADANREELLDWALNRAAQGRQEDSGGS